VNPAEGFPVMASCRECKTEVSSEALTCPRCGAPSPTGAPGAPQTRVEEDLRRIRGDVATIRWWLVTVPLSLLALYLAYYLLRGYL
jgi:hypothetical protein